MGVLATSLVGAAGANHAAIKQARNLVRDICIPFVTLIVVGTGCCQSIAADALLVVPKNSAVIRYSGNATDLLAEQALEMGQILRDLALVSRSAKRDSQIMSQARLDALLLKNSLVNMTSSLDRYRAFFSSLYRHVRN